MIYTLVTMAKDWLRERYNQQPDENDAGDDEEEKEEVRSCSEHGRRFSFCNTCLNLSTSLHCGQLPNKHASGFKHRFTLETLCLQLSVQKRGSPLRLSRIIVLPVQVLEAQGLPVTPETFAEWRERYDAEIALERAK